MDGFEDYLAAAFHAKQVPKRFVILTGKLKADTQEPTPDDQY
jgi:hypothetical protein